MAKGLGVVTVGLPELKDTSPEEIQRWAAELIGVLNLRDNVANAVGVGWRVQNLTTEDRTIDAASESAADVRTVLATLINDLLQSGRLGR